MLSTQYGGHTDDDLMSSPGIIGKWRAEMIHEQDSPEIKAIDLRVSLDAQVKQNLRRNLALERAACNRGLGTHYRNQMRKALVLG